MTTSPKQEKIFTDHMLKVGAKITMADGRIMKVVGMDGPIVYQYCYVLEEEKE